MINKTSVIKKIIEVLEIENPNSSFSDGKIIYNGNTYNLPSNTTNKSSRTTKLKYR